MASTSAVSKLGDIDSARAAVLIRFGTWLRRERERRGLSRGILAEASDLEVSTLQRMEEGTCDPPLTVVARLAIALEIDIRRVIYGQKTVRHVRFARR